MQLFLKILIGMANSVDPDQTAPSLFAYVILSDTLVFEILGHLPYISHILKKFTHSSHNLCLSNLNLLYPLKWLVGLEFNAPVNTKGPVEPVSLPNHTFPGQETSTCAHSFARN